MREELQEDFNKLKVFLNMISGYQDSREVRGELTAAASPSSMGFLDQGFSNTVANPISSLQDTLSTEIQFLCLIEQRINEDLSHTLCFTICMQRGCAVVPWTWQLNTVSQGILVDIPLSGKFPIPVKDP